MATENSTLDFTSIFKYSTTAECVNVIIFANDLLEVLKTAPKSVNSAALTKVLNENLQIAEKWISKRDDFKEWGE